MNVNKKRGLNPYVLVILSFVIVILIGSVLLCFPFCQKNNQWGKYIDSLTTAVSSTCVTGTNTYFEGIEKTLTFPGQIIVAVMIQIGGLGFVTILTFLITIFKSRLKFKDRYFISQMVNSTNFADVVKFVRKIILISFASEFTGFLLYMPVFFNMYKDNVGKALWNSAFHAISAFNNAGFDLLENSFIRTSSNLLGGLSNGLYIYFLVVTMILIIIGGISFLVITDIFNFRKKPRQWRAFTKIVLSTTGVLLVFGAVSLLLTDGFKGAESMSVLDVIFQSVTARTAGFATYNQDNISTIGKAFTCILMLVGGSPLSTAGGIKTTTLFMILLSMISYIRGKKVTAFKRSFSSNMILKCMTLLVFSIVFILAGYLALSYLGLDSAYEFETLGFKSSYSELCIYETFSNIGTVGLMSGIEPYLSNGSKIILCLLMFIGRLGPITFFQVFQSNVGKQSNEHYQYVEEDILIG